MAMPSYTRSTLTLLSSPAVNEVIRKDLSGATVLS